MKVYLIRHAQSEENTLDLRARTSATAFNQVIRASHAAALTEEGLRQAQAVVTQLEGAGVERLYCSPFVRSLKTAQVIGDALHLTPEVVDDLREVMPPELGLHIPDRSLRRFFLRSYLAMLWPTSQGETWLRAYRRARSVWTQLTRGQQGTIAVVSHRGFIFLILLSLRGSRSWQVLSRDYRNGGVSLVIRKDA